MKTGPLLLKILDSPISMDSCIVQCSKANNILGRAQSNGPLVVQSLLPAAQNLVIVRLVQMLVQFLLVKKDQNGKIVNSACNDGLLVKGSIGITSFLPPLDPI